MARDAETSRTTINGYLDIAEDTLLAFRLPAFESRMRVREKKHPKLYWVDAGVVRALKRQLGALASEERGSLFEGWVANLLRAYRDYRDLFDDWAYWAPAEATRTEVDFLLQRGRDYLAVEAKSATTIGNEELRGLRAIEGLPRLRRRILVHPRGRPRVTQDGIEIWPADRFVEVLEDGELWPA